MNLRQGATIGQRPAVIPADRLDVLEWLIHAGLEDCRSNCARASIGDLRHAIQYCTLNPVGNASRKKVLESALKNRTRILAKRHKKGGRK
jgi:hypothetical protein